MSFPTVANATLGPGLRFASLTAQPEAHLLENLPATPSPEKDVLEFEDPELFAGAVGKGPLKDLGPEEKQKSDEGEQRVDRL